MARFKKTARTTGPFSGKGKVYREDQPIADVWYSLQVKAETDILKTFSGINKVEGLIERTGRIIVIKGERNLLNSVTYTLQLDDGYRWNFQIKGSKPQLGMYDIVLID